MNSLLVFVCYMNFIQFLDCFSKIKSVKIMDKPTKEGDLKLAEHVLRAHRLGEGYRSIENTFEDFQKLPPKPFFMTS